MSELAESIQRDVEARVKKIEGEVARELQAQLTDSRERLEKAIRQNLLIAASLLLTILAATLIVGYTQAQSQVQDRVYSLNQELISLQKDLIATHKDLQIARDIVSQTNRKYLEAEARLQDANTLLEQASNRVNLAGEKLADTLMAVESGKSRIDGLETEANVILASLRDAKPAASQR